MHPGQAPDFAEITVSAVELKYVPGKLTVVAHFVIQIVLVPAFEKAFGLEATVGFRHHFGNKYVGPAVVVDIGHVGPHAAQADFRHMFLQYLAESAVAVVDVEIIAFEEIVGNINIRPAIAVYIAYGNPQAEADRTAVYAGLLAHIDKISSVIAEQLITAHRIALLTQVSFDPEAGKRKHRIVEQVTIEVAVAVVIKKCGMHRKPLFGQAVLRSPLGKCEIAVVDEQLVVPVLASR